MAVSRTLSATMLKWLFPSCGYIQDFDAELQACFEGFLFQYGEEIPKHVKSCGDCEGEALACFVG